MWTLHVQSGWQEGSQQDLVPGLNEIGAADTATILLLDPQVPPRLVDIVMSETGTLQCTYAAESLQFSYDNLVWTPVRKEPLFSVDLHFRIGSLQFALLRRTADQVTASDTQLDTSDTDTSISPLPQISTDDSARGWARWYTRLKANPALVAACRGVCQSLSSQPKWVIATGGAAAVLLAGLIMVRFIQVITPDPTEVVAPGFEHPSGLTLSYSIDVHHQAPPGALSPDAPVPLGVGEDRTGTTEAAGQDTPDPSSELAPGMKLSYSLSFGKPVEQAGKQAEPAFLDLREQLSQTAWGSRVIVNALDNQLTLRGQLSEVERREFERVLQRTVRTYGSTVVFKATIEPLDTLPDLQIKQVLGGATPMVVLQDGSRLVPGSYYDGKLVESISTDRIVLRGKDRIEIPI